jgi:hypothetical protein
MVIGGEGIMFNVDDADPDAVHGPKPYTVGDPK